MQVDWSMAETVLTALAGGAGLLSLYVGLTVRAAVADLKAAIAEQRMQDREEMRSWINGSFMRAGVAEARIESLTRRLDLVEEAGLKR